MILVDPTERQPLLRLLGQRLPGERIATGSRVAQFGADFLFRGSEGWVGVQRKAYPDDLIASVEGGRLQEQVYNLVTRTSTPVLLLEGSPSFTSDGSLLNRRGRPWTRRQLRNLIRSVAACGIAVEWVADTAECAEAIAEMVEYYRKPEHTALITRPKIAVPKNWGMPTRLGRAMFFLQGLPGVGPTLARAMLEHFGQVPLEWTCTRAELLNVPNVGPKRVADLWEFLEEMRL